METSGLDGTGTRSDADSAIVPAPPALSPGKPRFQRLRVIAALMLRGMDTRSERSAGGYLWAIGEPVGGILLLSVVFGLTLRTPPLGTSFLLFYATGVLPFRLYGAMAGQVSAAVSSNRGLLAYPVVSPLDAVIAKFLLAFLTDSFIAVTLFGGIALTTDADFHLDLGPIAAAFSLAALLGLGIGTLNCVLFGMFPTWKNIWSVLTRPLFLMSGVFFLYEGAPTVVENIIWWNPILQIIGLMRSGFYANYHADYVNPLYIFSIAATTFVIGAWLLRRHASYLIEQ